MLLWPLGPQNINELMIMNDHVGFEWIKTDITLFWLPYLAALTTEEFEDGTISWLRDDTDSFWLDALGSIVLGFITQVAASLVAICRKSMDKKAMQTIFCSVLMSITSPKSSPQILKILCVLKEKPLPTL